MDNQFSLTIIYVTNQIFILKYKKTSVVVRCVKTLNIECIMSKDIKHKVK